MLMVVFHLGNERYAVRADVVVEIVPLISLSATPQAPAYIAGMFNYRAQVTPVIDMCQLALNRPCRQFLSTRIMIIDYDRALGRKISGRARNLGLLAERVTEICAQPTTVTAPPVAVSETPYLGDIFYTGTAINQCVELSKLLPVDVREKLFADCAKSEAASVNV